MTVDTHLIGDFETLSSSNATGFDFQLLRIPTVENGEPVFTLYAYLADANNDRIVSYEVSENGTFSNETIYTTADVIGKNLFGVDTITSFSTKFGTYLFAGGPDTDDFSIFSVGTDGSLSLETFGLPGTTGTLEEIATAPTNNILFATVRVGIPGSTELRSYEIDTDGTLTQLDTNGILGTSRGLEVIEFDGEILILVPSTNSLQIFTADASDGDLSPFGTISASNYDTFVLGGRQFVASSKSDEIGSDSNFLEIYEIGLSGFINLVATIATNESGAVSAFEHNGEIFISTGDKVNHVGLDGNDVFLSAERDFFDTDFDYPNLDAVYDQVYGLRFTIDTQIGGSIVTARMGEADDSFDFANDFNRLEIGTNNGSFVTPTVIYGMRGRDEIIGGSDDNEIYGGRGRDTLAGGIGDDLLDGGGSADLVDYNLETVAIGGIITGVHVNLLTGVATDSWNSTDTLVSIENVTGTSLNDVFIGNDADNEFIGREGDDTFIGGDGDDIMRGWDGHDVVDYLSEDGKTGISVTNFRDVQDSFGNTDLITSIEKVVGTDYEDFIEGNGQDNTINGKRSDDILDGGDGDDVIFGGRGIDTIIGGEGSDSVFGGRGDDEIYFTENTLHNNEYIGGGLGNDGIFLAADSGAETFYQLADFSATFIPDPNVSGQFDVIIQPIVETTIDGIEYIQFTSPTEDRHTIHLDFSLQQIADSTGGEEFDLLRGDAGNISLNLEVYLTGRDDQDLSILNFDRWDDDVDSITIHDYSVEGSKEITLTDASDHLMFYSNLNIDGEVHGGAGSDTLDFSSLTSLFFFSPAFMGNNNGLDINFDTGFTNVVGAAPATGLETDEVENAIGTMRDDIFTGNNQINRFEGRNGNDVFRNIDQFDYIDGGEGFDTLDLSTMATHDAVFNVAMGQLRIDGGVAATVINVENVIFGKGDDEITIQQSAPNMEVIRMGNGDDVVYKDDGTGDVLRGGQGFDTLDFSIATFGMHLSLQEFTADDGTTYEGRASRGPTSTLDVPVLTNLITNFESFIGSNYADKLAGGEDDDILRGIGGNDEIFGDLGDDELRGGTGDDTIFGGRGADEIFGGADNDTITTGRGVDFVSGGQGDDFIIAGSGTNTLKGGNGEDVFHFTGAPGTNIVDDFENNTDTLELAGLGFDTVQDALDHATAVGDDVVFDFDDGLSITVQNITLSQISNDIEIV